MSVDRCICKSVSFKHLLELAKHLGTDIEALQRATGAGTGCGMCVPYIRVAIKTGKAKLPVMNEQRLQQALGDFSNNDAVLPGGDASN